MPDCIALFITACYSIVTYVCLSPLVPLVFFFFFGGQGNILSIILNQAEPRVVLGIQEKMK